MSRVTRRTTKLSGPMRVCRASTLMAALLLVSCGDTSENRPSPKTEPEVEAPIPPEVELSPSEPRPPLDLRLAPDSVTEAGESFEFERGTSLPNLFNKGEQNDKTRMSVGAKMLTDPASKNYVESVNGAEVSIEIQTGKKKSAD